MRGAYTADDFPLGVPETDIESVQFKWTRLADINMPSVVRSITRFSRSVVLTSPSETRRRFPPHDRMAT